MPEKIVQLNEEVIKGQLKELVRGSVEETLNELLEAEANKLTQAARYERNEQCLGASQRPLQPAISPPLPEISPSRCPSSRASPLRLQSLSGIAAVKAARGEALIEMYWLAYPSSTWRECYRGTMRKQSVTIHH